MKKTTVGIVDYGMGNLHSVQKSLEAAGARVVVSDRPQVLGRVDLLVVPGQGRFDAAMATLRTRKLIPFLKKWLREGRPYLGICLGLQILFDGSDEAPGARGLGWIPGRVKKFVRRPGMTVPHMGWNRVAPVGEDVPLEKDDTFYFVHSYFAAPRDPAWVGAETPYGTLFCSAVARGPLVATQFHPEKSGDAGLNFLKRILNKVR